MRLRRLLPAALVGTALLPAVAGGGAPGSGRTAPPTADRAQAPRVSLPIPFEPNQGQTDPAFRYLARGKGFLLLLEEDDAVCHFADGNLLRLRLAGEKTGAPLRPEARLPGVSNYFLGNDPARWRTRIPHYRSVLRKDARPGVDLRWRGDRGGIEYEALLAGGARHRSVAFEVEGAESLAVDRDGALLVRTPGGVLRHSKPIAFQQGATGECRVPARFVPSGPRGFRIKAGPCDPALPLVIDPRLEYSSYLGGSAFDTAYRVAVDSSSAIYVSGSTQSTNYPTAAAYQGSLGGGSGYDAVITKLNAAGSALVFSTYFGGSGTDTAAGLAVDPSGVVTVGGSTDSTDFPVASAFQATKGAYSDGWVARLSTSGETLTFSTHLGGNSTDSVSALAVDGAGATYATGYTASTDFPTQSPLQASKSGVADAFLTKFSSSGNTLTYSTHLGGSGLDQGQAIAVDTSGNCFLGGYTDSTNFPLQGAFQGTYAAGGQDAFVAKVASSGASLVYSSYLGGNAQEDVRGIAVDSTGAAVLTGLTGSTNFPLQSPLQGTYGGDNFDAFVTKVAADGASKTFSTFLGGSGGDIGAGVALDSTGAIYVAGYTYSSNFPVVSAIQGTLAGFSDAYVAKLNSAGSSLVYSTYLGGTGAEVGNGLALDGKFPVVSGYTESTDFPTQSPVQGSKAGAQDAFVVRIATIPLPPSGLGSFLVAVDGIQLDWTDNSSDEDTFEIARKTGNGAFGTRGSVAADVTTYTDSALARGTRYTYRVRALNSEGASAWSNEATTTTPTAIPGVPLTPSALTATVVSSTRIDLTWADESDNENYFKIQRRTGEGAWEDFSTPSPNVTSAIDDEVFPGRTYSYRIRAVNASGNSDYSEPVSASTPASMDVLLEKVLVKDVEALGKDRASLRGTLALNGDSPDGVFDPSTDGFEVRLGGSDGTPLAGVAAGDEGWVLKEGRHSWKSPKGSTSKVKVVVDTVEGTWTVTVQKGQFASIPENPVPVWVSVGDDAGSQSLDWRVTTGKAVVYRYP